MIHLHLHPDVKLHSLSKEKISLIHRKNEITISSPPPQWISCLRSLAEGSTEEGLYQAWTEERGDRYLFYYFLQRLQQENILSYRFADRSQVFFVVVPKRNWAPFSGKIDPALGLQMSRFAFFRQERGAWIIESPLSPIQVEIVDPALWTLAQKLASPQCLTALCAGGSQPDVSELMAVLKGGSLLSDADQAPSLAMWEFHDLVFHCKSRKGFERNPFGGTFRFEGMRPPLPAIKPPSGKPRVALPSPSLMELAQKDPPFSIVAEKRRSLRKHGSIPLTLAEWGEFLFRAARIQKKWPGPLYESTGRPSAGGGGCHELELYIVLQAADQALKKGLYRYDPEEHALEEVNLWNETIERVMSDLEQAAHFQGVAQAAILLAARFGRVSWKYESIAYATILKNTGALLQTLYLTATCMNLAPCAIGGGDSVLFAEVAETDLYAETTVGEFLIGSRD
ncbi:MAG: SagB family peptide dehydrogenase [Chlamydiales bacterium]